MGPRHRPPVVVRVLAALIGVTVLLFNAALMLSDRAPAALRAVLGDFAVRLSARIDAGGRGRILTDGRLPESDVIVHLAVWALVVVHLAVWALVVVLVGIAVWTWWALLLGALAVFAGSVVVEVAQGVYSTTRTVEPRDMVSNAYGVGLGVAAVTLLYLVGELLGSMFSGRTR